jgi:PAS domain-containing protein
MSAQKSCRELEDLLTVTAMMTDPVIACNECGDMVFANLAATQLFGEIDLEHSSLNHCPGELGIFDGMGLRMLEPLELPLAQAVYEGRVVRVNLLVRQDEEAAPVEATAFPVRDRLGRQVGAMMVCRCLGRFPQGAPAQHLA